MPLLDGAVAKVHNTASRRTRAPWSVALRPFFRDEICVRAESPFVKSCLSGTARGRSSWRSARELVLLLALAGLITPTDQLVAQPSDASRIAVGDSVRLRYPGAIRVRASFSGWQGDHMVLGVAGLDDPWRVSIFDLASLGVYTTRTPREGLRYHAILGAVGGMFAGAAVSLGLRAAGVVGGDGTTAEQVIATTVKWASLGIVGGAIAGGAYGGSHPGAGWVRIELPAGGR